MALDLLRFVCLVLVAIGMAGGLAHAFELPHKVDLSADAYLTVQQIYRGWALLGIPLFGALLATSSLAMILRQRHEACRLTAFSAALLAAGLVIFFSLTFPINQRTANWTTLPANWKTLRSEWEYSHAVNAALMCVAFLCLAWQSIRAHATERFTT